MGAELLVGQRLAARQKKTMGTPEGSSIMAIEGVQVEGVTRLHVKRPKFAFACESAEGGKDKQKMEEAQQELEQEEEEEILVLQGVAVPADAKVKMDVFISHKDHSTCQACHTCSACVFAGAFIVLPSRPLSAAARERPPLLKSKHRMGISQILRELNIQDDDSFYVALVPSSQNPNTPISIQSITLEYE